MLKVADVFAKDAISLQHQIEVLIHKFIYLVGQAKIAWFHEDCFNRTNLWGLKDLETVEMDALSWEDQNRLREKLTKLMNNKNPAKK